MTSARDALNKVIGSKATFTVPAIQNLKNDSSSWVDLLQWKGVFAITTASLCFIGDSKSRTLRTRWAELLRGVGPADVVGMLKDPTALFHVLDTKGLEWPDIQADMTRYPQFDLYSIRQARVNPYQRKTEGIAGRLKRIESRLEAMEKTMAEILKRLPGGEDFEV